MYFKNMFLSSFLCLTLGFVQVLSLFENTNETEVIQYLETYINESLVYEPPADFTPYIETTNNETIDFGSFDFIIIGSGPSGCVMANRLSEIASWNVLLIEAGDEDTDVNKMLGMHGYAAIGDNNWGYQVTPQDNACGAMVNRSCAEGAGRVLGGGGSINGGYYLRAHKADFDRWVDIYGANGWSYEEVLPYYKKSENASYEPLAEGYHSTGGYLTVSNDVDSLLTPYLIQGFEEAGYNNTDFNGPSTVGVSRVPLTYSPNERVNPPAAFLRNFVNRTNLQISLNSFVTRVIISKDTLNATGVEFVKNQTTYVAFAKYEVIVSGGPWMSAFILMHSGIGPCEHLESLSIEVIVNLPVGQQVQDHVNFNAMSLRTNQTLFNYTFDDEVELYRKHMRPLTNTAEVIGWSDYGENTTYVRPNIEYVIASPYGAGDALKKLFAYTSEAIAAMEGNSEKDASGSVYLFHPKSRGTITLQSNDPKDRPLINPNILSDASDVNVVLNGIKHFLALNKTSVFRTFGIEPYVQNAPGCDDEKYSDAWLICAIKYWGNTGFHGVAANAIGNDSTTSVVNPKLLVHGIGNLRVVDTSIAPESPSGHPQSLAYMIAEYISDVIKEAYGKL